MAKFKKSARNGSRNTRKAGGAKLKMAMSMKSTKSAGKLAGKSPKLLGASQIEWKQRTQKGKQIGKDQDRNSKARVHTQRQHTAPTIPFEVDHKILLVGEGDLSFAASLIAHHGCANVLTTCFDSENILHAKYPASKSHSSTILTTLPNSILYDVDATKLPSQHKRIRTAAPFDRIIFNFPHVGGKSTDVNRQVRYNQELLSRFFAGAQSLLSDTGTVLVTLFEGLPYSLWNIRDLARHAELAVLRSFRFQAGAYPGYGHARTVGVIKTEEGEVSSTAWKGEERMARTYEFGLKGAVVAVPAKKKGNESSDDDDDD